MKTTLTICAMLGACVFSLGAPLTARAKEPATKAEKKAALVEKRAVAARRAAAQRERAETARRDPLGKRMPYGKRHGVVTGTYLPQTYNQNGPISDTTQPVRQYDRHELEKNGYYDIGSSLKRVDPSIQISGKP